MSPWGSLVSGMLDNAGDFVTVLLPLLAVPLGLAVIGGALLWLRRVVQG